MREREGGRGGRPRNQWLSPGTPRGLPGTHITKQGPAFIRQLLVQVAWQGVRRSPMIRAYFERIRRDAPDRRKISIVATAQYMLRAMLAMLQTGEVWREEVA